MLFEESKQVICVLYFKIHFFLLMNLHIIHDIIINFIVISVHTENSYGLWIYLYTRIYCDKVYLHRDPINTKATPSTDIIPIYEDIIRVKEKEGKRRERWDI